MDTGNTIEFKDRLPTVRRGPGAPKGKRSATVKREIPRGGMVSYMKERPHIEEVFVQYIAGGTCSIETACALAGHAEKIAYMRELAHKFGWAGFRRVFTRMVQTAMEEARAEAFREVQQDAAAERRIADAGAEQKLWQENREAMLKTFWTNVRSAKSGKDAKEWLQAIEHAEQMKPPQGGPKVEGMNTQDTAEQERIAKIREEAEERRRRQESEGGELSNGKVGGEMLTDTEP